MILSKKYTMNVLIELNMLEGGVKINILLKETSFKMELKRPVGGALMQVPLLATDKTSKKGGHFSLRILSPAFVKRTISLPQQQHINHPLQIYEKPQQP